MMIMEFIDEIFIIGSYPFTTIEPNNVGVCAWNNFQ